MPVVINKMDAFVVVMLVSVMVSFLLMRTGILVSVGVVGGDAVVGCCDC